MTTGAWLRRAGGFTVTEMMVALTLGLILLGGVTTVLVNSKKHYVVQDSLGRLQENARFALAFLSRDLRMAGHYGCSDQLTEVYNHVNEGATGSLFDADVPLEGYEQNGTGWYPSGNTDISSIYYGTDAITIRYASGADAIPVEKPYMPQESAALHIAPGNGLKKGDIVAVTDCASADIFQITGPDDPDQTGTINHNTGNAGVTPGNATKPLSKTYEEDSYIMKLVSVRYFVGTGASGNPALFRAGLQTDASGNNVEVANELVDGIENLQILYGEDTQNNDRIPDVYRTADQVSDWNNVVAVRITLLAYTQASATESGEYAAGADNPETTYDLGFMGSTADQVGSQTGNRKRRIFSTTVVLRNLQ